jgi:hypothetical protein
MKRRLHTPSGIVSIVLLLLVAGGIASAAIPSADGTIHACYNLGRGTFRVVDADGPGGGRCPDTETALSWNQKGPAGPQGGPGPQGPPGPAGPQGSFKGIRLVKAFSPLTVAASKTVTASCAAGEVVTGGGYSLLGVIDGRLITRNFPVNGNPPTAWQVKGRAPGVGKWRVRAWALCAKL